MKKAVFLLAGVFIMTGLFGCGKKVPEPVQPSSNRSEEVMEIKVTNQIKNADIWVLPDTEENRKLTVWGSAMISRKTDSVDRTLSLEIAADPEKYVIQMIDEDEMYYSAAGIVLEEGQSIVIREGEDVMSAFADVYGEGEEPIAEYEMFMARL